MKVLCHKWSSVWMQNLLHTRRCMTTEFPSYWINGCFYSQWRTFIGTRPRLHHQYDHEAAVCRCWSLKTSCLRKRSVWAALVFISRCVYSACNRGGWCVNCDPSDCSSDAAAPGATDPLRNLDTSENKVQLGCQFLDQTDLRSGWAEQREIPVMILIFWNEVH